MRLIRCMRCMKELDEGTVECPHCGYTVGTGERESYYLRQGTMLAGQYLIGCALGSGAFGITYAAFDTVLERAVAIKEYLPGELATRIKGQENVSVYDGEKRDMFFNGLEKFVDEAQRLQTCNSIPGIVKVYDALKSNGTAYIVMEYLEGRTLKETITARGGRIGMDETLQYMLPIMSALDEVHRLGLIHRDISPDNIMIDSEGHAKLFDFGASRYANSETSKSLSVLLKPGYAPEEQYRSRGKQGAWSDVYALAATIYKCITGVTPDESIERMANDTLKPPSKLGAKLSASQENAIMNALNRSAENRTRNCTAFATELCAEKTVRISQEKQRNPLSLNRPMKAVLAVAGVALAAVIALTVTGVINIGSLSVAGRTADIVLVPNMVRMTETDAMELLGGSDSGLLLVIRGRETNEYVASGQIMTQSPMGGARAYAGAAVNVTISDGAGAVIELGTVPDVVSRTEETATQMLTDSGYITAVETTESDNVAAGLVISQSVEAGTKYPEGETVTIVVSLGSDAQAEAQEIANTAVPDEPVSVQQPTARPTAAPQIFVCSEWMTELPSGVTSDKYTITTKQQHRYATTEYTRSSESSLDGWTLYNQTTEALWSDWSSWSDTAVTATDTCQVETQQVEIMKTQYFYWRYWGPLNSAGANKVNSYVGNTWAHYSKTWAETYMSSYTYYTNWSDTILTVTCSQGNYRWNGHASKAWFWENGNLKTRQVGTGEYTTQYRSRTVSGNTTTYYYSRVVRTGWEDTVGTPAEPGGSTIETRTLYWFVYTP